MPPPQVPAHAEALYQLLSALFDYIDKQVEPRNLGVVTLEKVGKVAEVLGMRSEFEG